jgi:hypothetical protein
MFFLLEVNGHHEIVFDLSGSIPLHPRTPRAMEFLSRGDMTRLLRGAGIYLCPTSIYIVYSTLCNNFLTNLTYIE